MSDTLQIRLSKKSQNEFRAICEETKMTQGDCMAEMIKSFKMMHGADDLPEHEREIKELKKMLAAIYNKYCAVCKSLDLQENLALQAVAEKMNSKDNRIVSLERQLQEAGNKLTGMDDLAEQLRRSRKMIEKCQEENIALDQMNERLRAQLLTQNDVDALKEENMRLNTKVAVLEAEVRTKDEMVERLMNQLGK